MRPFLALLLTVALASCATGQPMAPVRVGAPCPVMCLGGCAPAGANCCNNAMFGSYWCPEGHACSETVSCL